MTFPEYEEVEEPLLCFIYLNGGPDYQFMRAKRITR